MATTATTNKEKGNAAFKAGNYAEAIGHYTVAALADPSDPTFFLNRAAAYLKLSKNEDAERDCSTVLGLSKTNVKALYRRAQARVALQKLGEAHNDLQGALKLEPNNEAVKTELARVDERILSGKKANKPRSAPIEVSTPLASTSAPSSTTAPPKRRRVPITIVDGDDDDTPQPHSQSQPTPSPSTSTNAPRRTDNDLLNPISSRTLSPSTSTHADDKSTAATAAVAVAAHAPAPATTQEPTPALSFRDAKQVREAKSVGRVGGGIFRMSGNDTVFKTREVPAPASAPTVPPAPAAAPRTHLEFTRAWDRIPAADTAARWALLNTIPPISLPALFGASLEPALLASLVPVLAAAAAPPEQREAPASRDTVRAYMCVLTQVPRFRTVVQFLSRAERSTARAVWEAVVQGDRNAGADDTVEAARMWGFADA